MEKTKHEKAYLIRENKSFVPVGDVVDIHSHGNKEVIDKVTQKMLDDSHAHSNKTYLDSIETHINGRAPKAHASSATTYGAGTTTNYGHCKTINSLSKSTYVNGEALAAQQGYTLDNKKINKTDIITEIVSMNGNGTKELVINEKSGYEIINVYNGGIEYNGIQVTAVGYRSNTKQYKVYLSTEMTTQQQVALKIIWRKK